MNAGTEALPTARTKSGDLILRVLVAISIIGSAAYWAEGELFDVSRPATVFLKAIGVGVLSIIAFYMLRTFDGFLLGTALAFGCLGDILLGMGNDYFTFGLGSFLIGHLFYIPLFVRSFAKPFSSTAVQKAIAAGLIAYSLAMLAWLWPSLEAFAIPVAAYLFVITTMGVTSSLARFSTALVVTGAALFIFSDSLIAIGRFKTDIGLADHLIWPTYYIGQYLITFGCLRDKLPAA